MADPGYRVAAVTGASSGIGAATVAALAAAGLEVHALARRADRLAALAATTGCRPHVVDVTDAAALERVLAPLGVDVLVNNAGNNRPGDLASATTDDIDALLGVNLQAVLHACRCVFPGMLARDRGHVINVGSIAGHYVFPGHAAYQAAKAGIHALSRQLRVDALGRRVRVTEIVPGRTATEIFEQSLGDAAVARQRYVDGFELLQPADVADAIRYAVMAPAHVNVSLLELLPTLQVAGGLQFVRRE